MGYIVINRTQCICALCRYWNGAIGSTTIRVQAGAHTFQIDSREQQDCFRPGDGFHRMANHTCPYFKPRYDT